MTIVASDTPPHDVELLDAISEILACRFGTSIKINAIRRYASEYSSSFALEDIEVDLEAGPTLRLIFKNVGWQGLHEVARRLKPAFLFDPLREIVVYQELLKSSDLGTARSYGAVTDASRGRAWLFLENVPGLTLNQVGSFSIWCGVARWLAMFHCRFADRSETLNQVTSLIRFDEEYYRRWLDRARAFRSPGIREVDWIRLARCYDRAVDRLLARRTTLLHGEFYASNILVHETSEGCRVCPIDWEMASMGPGLIDLAALTSGHWTETERIDMIATYRIAMIEGGATLPNLDTLLADYDDCRLHIAIRWLGWSREWSPPPEHAHNWLADAFLMVEKIGDR